MGGWVVGSVVGSLVGSLGGWLVGWFVAWSVGWLVVGCVLLVVCCVLLVVCCGFWLCGCCVLLCVVSSHPGPPAPDPWPWTPHLLALDTLPGTSCTGSSIISRFFFLSQPFFVLRIQFPRSFVALRWSRSDFIIENVFITHVWALSIFFDSRPLQA